jgi:hypothetical protein
MGLDMYLYASKYITDESVEEINKLANTNNLPTPDWSKSISVEKTVGYWRKANAIHGWFVNKVGNGVDECQVMYLDREPLEQLRQDCIVALANPSREYKIENQKVFYLLCDYLNSLETPIDPATYENPVPPTDGFFFGSSELTDYYYYQLEYTIDLITSLLELDHNYSFHYQASW